MKKKGITLPKATKYAWTCLEHYYDDEYRVLINFNKNEDDEQLFKTQTLWLQQHFNYESISTLIGINQSMILKYKCHSNHLVRRGMQINGKSLMMPMSMFSLWKFVRLHWWLCMLMMKHDNDEYDNDFQGGRWCRQWKVQWEQWRGPWGQGWWWWGQVAGVKT